MSSQDDKKVVSTYSLQNNLMFIARFIWQHEKLVLPILFAQALLQALAPFITIFLPKMVIDAISLPDGAQEQLVRLLALATLLLTVVNVLKNAARRWLSMHANRNRHHLLQAIEDKSMSMDYAHVEDPDGQRIKRRAVQTISSNHTGGEAIVTHSGNLAQHLFGLLLYTAFVAVLNPWIVVALVLASMLGSLITRWAQNYEARHSDEISANRHRLSYTNEDTINYRNAKDLRLYSMSDWLLKRIRQCSSIQAMWKRRILSRYYVADVVGDLLAFARDAAAYIYLTLQVLDGTMSPGDFTLFVAAIAGISSWAGQISNDIALLNRSSLDIGYLRMFLDLPNGFSDSGEVFEAISSAPEIVFENVSFRYPGAETWSVRNLNLTIRAGEKLALVGVNGAGKTTCVKLLCGLYRPTEGRILINGIDTSRYNRDDFYRLFAVVFQEFRTLAFDVRQNVALSLPEKMNPERIDTALRLAGLEETVAALPFGAETPLTRTLEDRGMELSGGQTQKLMLARALYKDAPIVIMDEPTAALDPIAEAELYQHYDQLVGGKTSLYISHRLSSTRFCDRIVFLDQGQIQELGSHDELMGQGGAYARMYAVQAHYYQKELKEGDRVGS